MRWPWPSRAEVDAVVWAVIPRHGASTTEIAKRAGYRVARTLLALRRLHAAGLVELTDCGPTDHPGMFMTIWHAVDDGQGPRENRS